jgi:hypothetical protein
MATSFSRFARHIVAPAICAAAIGGAAIGLGGIANASTGPAIPPDPNPTVRGPLVVATPQTPVTPWIPPRHRVMVPRSDNGGSDNGGE